MTPFTRGLEGRVLRFVRRRDVLLPGEDVLVAVSGGQDSMALLLILARLAEELDVRLTVAHFDHMLRSRQEARDDEAAVRDLAAGLGLPFLAGAGDVPARARRRKESVEEAARHLRLDFLRREAKRLKADVVALGHTRDDRAETVLLHLLRGGGLDALIGLRPRSAWPLPARPGGRGPALARPLLEAARADTGRYCREAGLTPREDPTNLLLQATRNRLRHEVLPLLRRLNPRLDEALCRLGDAAAGTVDYLDAAADAEWRAQARLRRDGNVVFPRHAFASLAPALRARLLRRAVRRLASPAGDLEAVHIAAVEEALAKGRGSVSLPYGLTASVGLRDVRIGRPSGGAPAAIAETPLAVPGRTELPGWTALAEIIRPPPQPRPGSRFEAWLDADAVGQQLTVRSRRPGDRLRPLGVGGERKLQDLLVDAKVPREERDAVPLVCAAWGIAWVVGHRLDERAAVSQASKRVLHLRFERSALRRALLDRQETDKQTGKEGKRDKHKGNDGERVREVRQELR